MGLSVCLPVGPGLGPHNDSKSEVFEIWRKNWPCGDRSEPGQALVTPVTLKSRVGLGLGLLGTLACQGEALATPQKFLWGPDYLQASEGNGLWVDSLPAGPQEPPPGIQSCGGAGLAWVSDRTRQS